MFDDNDADFELDEEFFSAYETKKPTPTERTEIKDDNDHKFRKPQQQVVKRKFPGPAGILPDCKNIDLSMFNNSTDNNRILTNEIPCSQSSISIFQDELWLRVLDDFRQYNTDLYTIDWIKNESNLNRLHNQKAPFLAAIVQNLEYFDEKTAMINVQLQDPTGRIQGTMIVHRQCKEFQENLKVGCVIILKQFGVLTTDYTNNKNHYLTITPKNLIGIYYRQDNDIKKVIINDINIDKNKQLNVTDEHSSIWQEVLEGVDTDSLFEDF